MDKNEKELYHLILGMKNAYSKGENAMAYARHYLNSTTNNELATLIAYDLQAGSYIEYALKNPEHNDKWTKQLAKIIEPYVESGSSILEVGCGESTTLAGIISHLNTKPDKILGFDISWSRCAKGKAWLLKKGVDASLFVANLFSIPLADNSIDVVYTSHSLEPNGGREEEAIRELLRVARRAVILIEPIYELANEAAQARMQKQGYVQNLKATAEKTGASVKEYFLLNYTANPLNPSGAVVIEKVPSENYNKNFITEKTIHFQCPLTHSTLKVEQDVFVAEKMGIVYPVLRNIPLLRVEHAVIASGLT
jgi:ubiquinone/menaquinone biosynthesis C-methylase UbiE